MPKKKAKSAPPAMLPGESCESPLCEIRQSGIHGRGLFATEDIPAETYIIEYLGEWVDKEESDKRGWAQLDHAKETGGAAVYIFTLSDEYDIDGNVPENAARLINHSCEPNCEAYVNEEETEIWICAGKDIRKDDELFFNYGFDLDSFEDHPCRCGSEKCIGYILGEDYWEEMKERKALVEGYVPWDEEE